MQVAAVERRLLTCTEAVNTKFLVNQLRSKYNYQHLWTLNKKVLSQFCFYCYIFLMFRDSFFLNCLFIFIFQWETPKAVSIFLKNVPLSVDQEMIIILLAKASELRAIKVFK